MHTTHKNHIKILFTALIAIIIYHIYLYTKSDHFGSANDLYGPISSFFFLYGAIYGFSYVKNSKLGTNIKRVIATFSTAGLVYGLGLLIWGISAAQMADGVPYPSMADYLWVFYYVIFSIGIILVLRIYEVSLTIWHKLIAVVLLIGSYLTAGYFLWWPTFTDLTLQGAIDNAYVFGDMIVMCVTIFTLIISAGKISKGLFFITLAGITQFVGDILFTAQISADTFWDGNYVDFIFTLAGLFLSVGIIYLIQQLKVEGSK